MSISDSAKSSLSLLDAVEAVKNWRALLLLLGTVLVAVLCFAAFAALGKPVLIAIGALLAWAIFFYGCNAVGIMIFDSVNSGYQPAMTHAIVRSLGTSHRLLGVQLLGMLAFLAALLVAAMLLFTGKIPGIGPLFSFVFTPLSAIMLGFLWFVLTYVLLPFASVAIWSGETVMSALGNLIAIAKERLLTVVLQQMFLLFIATIAALVLLGMLLVGSGLTSAISDSVLSIGGGFGGGFDGGYGGGYGRGYGGHDMNLIDILLEGLGIVMTPGSSGLAVAFGLALVLPGLIAIQGMCQIYIAAIQGLDLESAKNSLQGGLAQVKDRMKEAQRTAQAAAESARRNAQQPQQQPETGQQAYQQPVQPTTQAPPTNACAICGEPLNEGDKFCGGCGNKTQG